MPSPPPDSPEVSDGGVVPVRVSKLLAERGLCSRREADRFIERGLVLLDGVPVSELGTKALPTQSLELLPEAHTEADGQVTILMHKPVGVVSGQPEDGYAAAVSLVQPKHRFAADRSGLRFSREHLAGLAVAGRLDIDSTGLLVLTQSGVIARRLIGQDTKIEKEYLVRVEGEVTDAVLARLCHGLELDGRRLKPARVTQQNADQLQFILREGRKRQIRRMCKLVGLDVVGLKRVRIGNVRLGKLPYGQWRYLARGEDF
ncbi:MAG: pseudouridine synthase [Candidatus Hydrogenedens sp.]|nr:pseudouridine synthase [Candidatus Hydrogenedens sp.]